MQLQTIAFFNWLYPYGGAETVTHNLASFFHKQGYRIILYIEKLNRELLCDEERAIFQFRELPAGPDPKKPANVDFLCRSLQEESVDCIIVQGIDAIPFAEIKRRTRCRMIFCLHNIPFWEEYAWRELKSTEIPNPTFLRRLEFLFLRRPLDRITRKRLHRTEKMYAGMMPHLDRMLLLCDQYKEDFMQAQGFRPSRKRRSRIEIRSHTQSAPACGGRPRIAQRKDRPVRRTLPQSSQTGRSPAENMENRRTQESRLEADSGRMRRGRREPAQISRKTTVAAGRIRRLSCRCNAILPQGDIHVPDL